MQILLYEVSYSLMAQCLKITVTELAQKRGLFLVKGKPDASKCEHYN